MTTISKNTAALTSWLGNQSVQQQTTGKLPAATAQRAATELGLSLGDVHDARQQMIAAQADVGQSAGSITGRGQTSSTAQRGAGAASAAVVARTNGADPRTTAFESSTYSQLDVKTVAKALGLSPAAAKQHIGDKILRGQEAELQKIGVTPDQFDSHELRDVFSRSAYTTADAKAALKAFDFLSSVDDAREYIGLKVINGYEQMLADEGITQNNFDKHDCLAAFAKSTYSQADVDAAKQSFGFLRGLPDSQVREYMGLKIVNGYEQMLADVGITPHTFDKQDCLAAFAKSTYSKADVDTARKSFDFLKNDSDAGIREYMGLKIVNGYEQMLADVGITPASYDKQDCLAAFAKSTYSKADVDTARKSFDFLKSDNDATIKEYMGLKIVNGTEQMLADVGITPAPYDQQDCLAAFAKSGYSKNDVAAARKAFDFLKSDTDAGIREYIGLKIINGTEKMLADAGITPN